MPNCPFRHFGLFSVSGRNSPILGPRQYRPAVYRIWPVNLRSVRKLDDEFVNDRVLADSAADQSQPKIRRIDGNEMISVEPFKLFVAHPTRHSRYVIDIWLRNHRCHRGVYITL